MRLQAAQKLFERLPTQMVSLFDIDTAPLLASQFNGTGQDRMHRPFPAYHPVLSSVASIPGYTTDPATLRHLRRSGKPPYRIYPWPPTPWCHLAGALRPREQLWDFARLLVPCLVRWRGLFFVGFLGIGVRWVVFYAFV